LSGKRKGGENKRTSVKRFTTIKKGGRGTKSGKRRGGGQGKRTGRWPTRRKWGDR